MKLNLKTKEDKTAASVVTGSEITYAATPENEGNYKFVESPLVGVFHSYNSELGEPYVTVGERVNVGQVVGIIEAMKLMNEVCSNVSGTVEEILVANEQTVEYGQLLVKIKED